MGVCIIECAGNNSGASGGPSYRFGAPDARASYSERRLMNARTAHSHPSAASSIMNGSVRNGAGSGNGSVNMATLSRSNGSLANPDTDANGNTKHKTRTQVPFYSL